jgi:hypothetical protein
LGERLAYKIARNLVPAAFVGTGAFFRLFFFSLGLFFFRLRFRFFRLVFRLFALSFVLRSAASRFSACSRSTFSFRCCVSQAVLYAGSAGSSVAAAHGWPAVNRAFADFTFSSAFDVPHPAISNAPSTDNTPTRLISDVPYPATSVLLHASI